jgi:hypothetical protein
MKRRLSWAIWFVAVLVAAAMGEPAAKGKPTAAPVSWLERAAAKKPAKPRPVVTMSRETTYVMGPLREDGYPDYLAAINEIASKGVTPEDNAVVLLVQACGPRSVYTETREKWFKMVGIRPLPEKGQYFVSLSDYVDRQRGSKAPTEEPASSEALDDVVRPRHVATERPWASKEFPVLARWLQANDRPLELVVAASKRHRFYGPMFVAVPAGKEPSLCQGALLPHVDWLGETTRALAARAMLRVAAGELPEAHQDLLACHRLARLVSQGPWLVESAVAHRIEAMACRGDAALAHYGHLSAEEAAKFAGQVRDLPPMARAADKFDLGERMALLDAVCVVARSGPRALPELATLGTAGEIVSSREEAELGWLASSATRRLIDWSEALRVVNGWFDRTVAALTTGDRRERGAAMARLDADFRTLAQEARESRGSITSMIAGENGPAAGGRRAGRALIACRMPGCSWGVQAENQTAARQQMVRIAFALAAYRADHGGYPAELVQLVPKCLKGVPEDPFSDKALRYRREGTGYVLYSVGPNGQDDDARESPVTDPNTGQTLPGDDIVTRMPVAEKNGN